VRLASSSRVLLALPVVVGACDVFDSRVCTAHIAPGISVTITDSVSGEPRAAEAVALAREGAFVDTLGPAGFQGNVMISRQGAHERPGFYEVVVRAPGYGDWVQTGVIVRPGDCHVNGVQLAARLQLITR
jgi:hypothetical protein